MILQNLVFPKIGICTEEKLYFHELKGDGFYDYETNSLQLKAGEKIQLNTYFNSFLADRWMKYTNIVDVNLHLKGEGQGILKIYRYSSFNGKELVQSQKIVLRKDGVDIRIFGDVAEIYGIIYFSFEALTEAQIVEGSFYTQTEASNQVALGIVITTYKREPYVLRNMKSLEALLFDKIPDENLHIFIIDNGQTLPPSQNTRITIIPNKNYGGAGGFGKGMLEIYKDKKYNQVVFCDDDAVYEPEAFLRLFNFLSLAKNPELCMGGSMLKLDDPKYIYESGAVFSNLEGRPNKNMLDMTQFSSLINFNIEEYATYHAWWFFACPVSCVEKIGFPVPVFFQMDDIEYSLRLREHGYETAELNGVCVWHESFQRKSSTATNYYWVRNDMLVSFIHNKKLSKLQYIKWFSKYFLQSLLVYRYDRAQMMLRGAEDVLKGPAFLMNLDPSSYHQSLLKQQIDKTHPIDRKDFDLAKYNRPVRKDKIKKLAMMLTLNGMLLPSFLINHGQTVNDEGYVLEPLQSFRMSAVFRKETVLYVDDERMSGFEVHRSSKMFWSLLLKLIKMDWNLYCHLDRCEKDYRKAFGKITSLEFWQEYVGNKGK